MLCQSTCTAQFAQYQFCFNCRVDCLGTNNSKTTENTPKSKGKHESKRNIASYSTTKSTLQIKTPLSFSCYFQPLDLKLPPIVPLATYKAHKKWSKPPCTFRDDASCFQFFSGYSLFSLPLGLHFQCYILVQLSIRANRSSGRAFFTPFAALVNDLVFDKYFGLQLLPCFTALGSVFEQRKNK